MRSNQATWTWLDLDLVRKLLDGNLVRSFRTTISRGRAAALWPTLDTEAYSAQVTATSGEPGIALLEIYAAGTEGTAQLSSLSARALVLGAKLGRGPYHRHRPD
jgi:hypothetical protein